MAASVSCSVLVTDGPHVLLGHATRTPRWDVPKCLADPPDVLVLHDEPIPTAALVAVRLIGVIEAEQTEQGNTVRNDRLLAATTCSHQYEQVTEVGQLGTTFIEHLTKFWVNHNALKGKAFDVRGVHGPDRAADAIEKATKADTASDLTL